MTETTATPDAPPTSAAEAAQLAQRVTDRGRRRVSEDGRLRAPEVEPTARDPRPAGE